jgi:DNA-binding MurR/RpiR family transcriptional regulator
MARTAIRSDAPPIEYQALEDLIAERYGTLSGQLQRIARFALDNPNDLALETVTELASRIGVQPSSMVRFAKALGFSGFSPLQQIFRSNLVARSGSYSERIRTIRDREREATNQVLAEFVGEGIASLEHLGETTSTEALEAAIRILADAEEIYVVAQGRSFPVAFYVSYALARLERRCFLLDGVGGMMRQYAELATSGDALIAISFHPYTPQVTEIVANRNEQGVPIIAITDSALSPLALEASVAFHIREPEPRRFRSLVAPMCLAQTLIVGLGHVLAARENNTS